VDAKLWFGFQQYPTIVTIKHRKQILGIQHTFGSLVGSYVYFREVAWKNIFEGM